MAHAVRAALKIKKSVPGKTKTAACAVSDKAAVNFVSRRQESP